MNINEVELASNLAHNATKDEIFSPLSDLEITNEDDMWEEDENENTIYKDKVQDVFNRWYDYFYDEITKCKEL